MREIERELARLRTAAARDAKRDRARDVGRKVILGRILIVRSERGDAHARDLCLAIPGMQTERHNSEVFEGWKLGFGGPSVAPEERDEDRARRRVVHRQIVLGGGLLELAGREGGDGAREQIISIMESLEHQPDIDLFEDWKVPRPPSGESV